VRAVDRLTCAARTSVLVVLACLSIGCGRRSGSDIVGPPPVPPAPVFEYVQLMIDDPWFSDSLPGELTEGTALVSIREAVENRLRLAVEAKSLTDLENALGDLETGTALYRTRQEFDPADGPLLAALDLFVQQARAIRDGKVAWTPAPLLQRDKG
jgi:hypothetical protein